MSATSARGWLDGTLDVISGKAPRPSSFHGTARSPSPVFLQRVPSEDALERSSHNESGHGKSTAQMVKDLRASNAKLTAKTADLEVDFMNQLNDVTIKFAEEKRELQESLTKKEKLINEMESRGVSVETRIRERDAALSKLKEETAFQRHTIADLKNQLYQLQNDVEEAEYDKKDEVDKWNVEKQQMTREMESLKKQFEEFRDENESLRSQLSDKDAAVEDSSNVMQNWKKLEEAKKALTESQRSLNDTKSSLAALENESKRTQKEHESALKLVHAKLAESQETLSVKEREWKEQLALAQNNNDLTSKLEEHENVIAGLKGEIVTYANQAAALKTENAKLHAEAESRDSYRQDEATDLRLLNDSHLEEIQRLKDECDELERAIAERDEALMESMEEADTLHKHVEELSIELMKLQDFHGTETEERVLQLEVALRESNEAYRKLDDDMSAQKGKYEQDITSLQTERDKLVAERDDAESRITVLEDERDDARRTIDRSLEERQSNRVEEESRLTKRLQNVVATAAKERADLEKEHDELLADFEKAKKEEIALLQKSLDECKEELSVAREEVERVRRANETYTKELSEFKAKFDEAETRLQHHARAVVVESEETRSLREKLENETKQGQQALREAQIALVALDDAKQQVEAQLTQTRANWEVQRSELIDHYEGQLLAKEEELAQVSNRSGDARHLTDLVMECAQLEEGIKRKDLEIMRLSSNGRANSGSNGNGGALEDALRKELIAAKDAEENLAKALALARSEKQEYDAKVKVKLDDRDTTISTLVKSSVSQEQKLTKMKNEIDTLKSQLTTGSSKTFSSSSRENGLRDEVDMLRNAIEECKETEKHLHGEVGRLEKALATAQKEVIRLRNQIEGSRSPGSDFMKRERSLNDTFDNDHYETLRERDSAIATLVKQSMSQEAIVKKLSVENDRLREDIKRTSPRKHFRDSSEGPSWDEMKQLQKESEIFASQIIEQDEEIQALRCDLEDRDKEVIELRKDLDNLQKEYKSSPRDRDLDHIDDLQAELDEMQEANETQRQEIRDLRRQIRDSQAAFDTVDDLRLELELANKALSDVKSKAGASAQGETTLRNALNAAIASKDECERRLAQELVSMQEQRVAVVEEFEAKLRNRDAAIKELKEASNKGEIESLKAEVEKLKKESDSKSSSVANAEKMLDELRTTIEEKSKPDEEKAALMAENSQLMSEVTELKGKLEVLEEDMVGINELKTRLREAEDGRESAERNIVDSYERKITLMRLNTDVSIDNVRKELLEAKTQNSEIEADMLNHIKMIEMENKDLKDELEAKLQLKNTKIDALEHTLAAQEQLVENMRQEMDHLQGSMERSTIGRRAEIEEMQQEVIDSTGKAQKLEREITSLKMKLEQRELEHESQMQKMEERLISVQESPLARTMTKETTERIADLKEKFENLKWRNTSLQEENKNLRLKLEKAQDESISMKNDVYRASALENENENLEKRVEELEGEKSVWTLATMPTSRNPNFMQSTTQSSQTSGFKPPTPTERSTTRPSSRVRATKSSSASGGVKTPSSPATTIRKSKQSKPESPARSVVVPSSPGRFFLKRRPPSTGDTPKDDNSAASKLTF